MISKKDLKLEEDKNEVNKIICNIKTYRKMNSELLKSLMPTQKNGKIDRELSLYAQEVLMQDIDIS